ncbi:MAG: HAD hydrolase-like protein [Sphaerochaetaceae bacterium]|nr:HAD hydrolase-like protein [Spirochaetales bacterium]MDY5498651.1 HAD hydrolase-like protein [Sphaerochaetaceae bacterium]
MADKRLVILDLDGTLVDTSEGIFDTARFTAMQLGVDPDVPMERMRRFIGPPLDECFRIVYGWGDEQIRKAYPIYQARYRAYGQFLGKVYDGIPQVLSTLHSRGYLLAVGTLKNETVSLSLLRHFGLLDSFDVVHGDAEHGGRTKSDVLSMILADLRLLPSEALLVGDSMHDLNGAAGAGVSFIAAAYGFGFPTRPVVGPSVSAVIDKPLDLLPLLPAL